MGSYLDEGGMTQLYVGCTHMVPGMHIQVPTDLAQPALARVVHQLKILQQQQQHHHHHHQPGVYW